MALSGNYLIYLVLLFFFGDVLGKSNGENLDQEDQPQRTESLSTKTNSAKKGYGFTFHTGRKGLRITTVIEKSPAHKAGLVAGDYISKIGDQKTDGLSMKEIWDIFKRTDEALFSIKKVNGKKYNFKLEKSPFESYSTTDGRLITTGPRLYFTGYDSGDVAANFNVSPISGENSSLYDLSAKVKLLSFWATWCSPCHEQLPDMKKIHKRFKNRGFEIISISIDEDLDMALRFIKTRNMNWYHHITANDTTQNVEKDWGPLIPASALLDENNVIISTNVSMFELYERLKNTLD